jgi:hypothetical protein
MQIHSLSRALVGLLLIMLFIVYYLYEYVDRSYSIYVIVPVFFGVVLYVFYGPIDHWWREKYPITLDPKIETWLQRYFPPYTHFSSEELDLFRNRLSLYIDARLFQSVGSELGEVPYDIKSAIAAHGVHMSLNKKDYLIGDVDRIYVYKHPFPTPLYHHLHSVETHVEDGTIILNTEQLINSIINPESFYNIAYHAYAEVMISIYKLQGLPNTWDKIMLIRELAPETIISQVGMPIDNPSIVHVACYFSNPDRYKAYAPTEYETISRLFGK